MTPPIHVGLAQHPIKTSRGRGLSQVMSMSPPVINFSREDLCKRAKIRPSLVVGFSDKDLVGTAQPHVDTLVVIVRIEGFDVHKVMVNEGSRAKIMYPNLFRGLGLKKKDLELWSPTYRI